MSQRSGCATPCLPDPRRGSASISDGATMQSALIANIRSAAPNMTPALARVADHVLGNAQAVLYQSITELAEEASSSEASVMRFCRELGFTGFQNFKLMLAQELATQGLANTPVTGADSVQSLIETAKIALDET